MRTSPTVPHLLGVLLLVSFFNVSASAPRSSEPLDGPSPEGLDAAEAQAWGPTPSNPLSCVQRVDVAGLDQVVDLSWAPGGSKLALTRVVTSPSARTITGYEEDPFLAVLDLATGKAEDLGAGARARWSASGDLLAFWRGGRLYIHRGTERVTVIDSTVPDVRWVGEELVYFFQDQIRGWSERGDRLISTVGWDHMPRFPKDDTYFSGDGALFIVTRYSMDGSAYRYIGQTATGHVAPLETAGTTYTEWAPTGQTLLVRSDHDVELRGPGGVRTVAPVSAFPGAVHGWTPDGKGLLMGGVTATVPSGAAFDRFAVWEGGAVVATATLPNLIGGRAFSPDGRYFAGIARAGVHETALEIYRCGTRLVRAAERADPVSRAREARIAGDGRRLVRPVSGFISQFLQGSHTGVDIAAPFGAIIAAADEGEVTHVGWVPVGGRAVCVTHSAGLESCYYHTSLSYVTVGQRVARGQPIAAIGMSGLTTGAHVHWEVKQDGRIVDPLEVRR
ncbi:MAG: peptidoglycan DD-metalloendopeptidase family protein [Candidatus Limnocylindria bacterium]